MLAKSFLKKIKLFQHELPAKMIREKIYNEDQYDYLKTQLNSVKHERRTR